MFGGDANLTFADGGLGVGSTQFWSDSWIITINRFARAGVSAASASPASISTYDRGIAGTVFWVIAMADPILVIR